MLQESSTREAFATFVEDVGERLRRSLIPAVGVDAAHDATADALAYAWENWTRVRTMENPGGYLYRVAQTSLRRAQRRPVELPRVESTESPWIEPGLPDALLALSVKQRTAVWLVHGLGWTRAEVGRQLGVSPDTVRTHLERGMAHLRRTLGGIE